MRFILQIHNAKTLLCTQARRCPAFTGRLQRNRNVMMLRPSGNMYRLLCIIDVHVVTAQEMIGKLKAICMFIKVSLVFYN